jgi:hypothetical protein
MARVRWSIRGGVALLALAAGCGQDGPEGSATGASGRVRRADEVALADGRRPGTVPPGFVPTPHGWFHPSCVVEVRKGERLREDFVEAADGSRRALGRCAHPSYDPRGAERLPQPTPPPYIDQGWIEAAETRAGAIEWLSATWTVPLDPAVAGSQTVYLFPGIVPLATNDTILQPVLGWNALDDHRWTIASWNCCRNGNALHSELLDVPAGADVTGTVAGSGCASDTGVCSTWRIETAATTGGVTALDTDSYGEALDRTFAGALEVYSVGECGQLPTSGSVTFRALDARLVGGGPVPTAWTPDLWSVTPACSYGVVRDPAAPAVQLRWCAPATCAGLCGSVTDSCGGTLACPACAATGGCKKGTRCCKPGATQCALCLPTKQACPR